VVKFTPRPKTGPMMTVYSTAHVLNGGQIEEIVGVRQRLGKLDILRSRTATRHGYVVIGNKHIFLTRRAAVMAGRAILRAHANKYRQMAKELK
jgi:hypothetical protein